MARPYTDVRLYSDGTIGSTRPYSWVFKLIMIGVAVKLLGMAAIVVGKVVLALLALYVVFRLVQACLGLFR